MSLKTFHLIFIACSGILAVMMAFWGLRLFMQEGSRQGLAYGSLGVLLAIALYFYERWFSGKNGPLARNE